MNTFCQYGMELIWNRFIITIIYTVIWWMCEAVIKGVVFLHHPLIFFLLYRCERAVISRSSSVGFTKMEKKTCKHCLHLRSPKKNHHKYIKLYNTFWQMKWWFHRSRGISWRKCLGRVWGLDCCPHYLALDERSEDSCDLQWGDTAMKTKSTLWIHTESQSNCQTCQC